MINEDPNRQTQDLLKQSIAPARDTELRRDLWPQMLARIEQQPHPLSSVPWFDWALAAILCAVLIFFPGSIPVLLYHL
jgi:hypothetical protein